MKCDGRTFAVGSGDVDDRRQPALGMTERRQQAFNPAERQVDTFGMERQQSGVDGADRPRAGTRLVHAGAGRLKRDFSVPAAAGAFNNSRQSRAMVSRSLWRWTTMSTMP